MLQIIAILFILLCSNANAADSKRLAGIDVSHHNGAMDWKQIEKNGTVFVFLKATDGLTYLDPTFNDHFAALKNTKLIRGAYHFYEANDDGLAQAEWFIKNVTLLPGDLPPVVDIEQVKAPVSANLHSNFKQFIDRLEQYYGRSPIIYTGEKFWDHVMRDHLPGHKLWIAHYGVQNPTIPPEWQSWSFWQYTEECKVEGAEKMVDCSYFNGEEKTLHALLLAGK